MIVSVACPDPAVLSSGMYVWDGTTWRKVLSDASGKLTVLADPSDGYYVVKQTDPTSLLSGIHAWSGSNWQKIKCDAAGELQVDVLSSALPTGAAREATLSAINASKARLHPWDRTPATRLIAYSGLAGSGIWTLHASYTVPLGKKALLQHIMLHSQTIPVSAYAGMQAKLTGYPMATLLVDNNAKYNELTLHVSPHIAMLAGEDVALWSIETVAGGHNVEVSAVLLEFDA